LPTWWRGRRAAALGDPLPDSLPHSLRRPPLSLLSISAASSFRPSESVSSIGSIRLAHHSSFSGFRRRTIARFGRLALPRARRRGRARYRTCGFVADSLIRRPRRLSTVCSSWPTEYPIAALRDGGASVRWRSRGASIPTLRALSPTSSPVIQAHIVPRFRISPADGRLSRCRQIAAASATALRTADAPPSTTPAHRSSRPR